MRALAQHAGWSPSALARACATPDGAWPVVEFAAEAEHCPHCHGPLHIQKTRRRRVLTLAGGAFVAKEIRKHCAACTAVFTSAALAHRVPARARYGYDLIVYVGLARYLRGKQRGEIRTELIEHFALTVSTGTVSNLCDRFLVHLAALHRARAPALRAAMASGYPLHFDATCEAGKGGLMVCLDGWRGWVLVAGRIPTEHEQHLRPLIERTVALFGEPVATVRDCASAGANALEMLRTRDVPDLVCHYHFLRAVGDKLFDTPYATLRKVLREHAIRRDLHELLRELKRYTAGDGYSGRFGNGRVRTALPALVLWVLEGRGHKEQSYPFGLTHLGLVQRCTQVRAKTECWLPSPCSRPERRALNALATVVGRLQRDRRCALAVQRLGRNQRAFDELRAVLQLSNAELPGGDQSLRQRPPPALEARRMQHIEQAVNAYRDALETRVGEEAATPANPSPSATILKYLQRYGARLFGHPTRRDDDGQITAIVERTNNVAEHFFARQKQQLRRRLGRAHLGRDLDDQPAQAALSANLQHADYVRILCGSLDHLAEAFAELEAGVLDRGSAVDRTNRNSALQAQIRALLKQEPIESYQSHSEPSAADSSTPATVS